jgi:hypothetical protein
MADELKIPAWWKNGDWCWIGLVHDMAKVVDDSGAEYADQNAEGLRDLIDRLIKEWGVCCAPCQEKLDAEAVAEAVMNGGEA